MKIKFTLILLFAATFILQGQQDKSLNKQNQLTDNERLGKSEVTTADQVIQKFSRITGTVRDYNDQTGAANKLGQRMHGQPMYVDDDPELEGLTEGTYKTDSVIEYDVDQGVDWKDNSRFLFNYNDSGQLTLRITQALDTLGNWKDSLRLVNTYNVDYKLLKTIQQFWVDSTGEWVNLTLQDSSVYDTSGNLVERYNANWNAIFKEWMFLTANYYSYDTNNVLTVDTSLIFSDNVWIPERRKSYYYNFDGTIDYVDDRIWGGSVFELDRRNYYNYDDDNHPGKVTEISVTQHNGSYFQTHQQYRYYYDALGNLSSEMLRDYNSIDFIWENNYRIIYNYNPDGNLEYLIHQEGDVDQWINFTRSTYYYGQGNTAVRIDDEEWDTDNQEWRFVRRHLRTLDQDHFLTEQISQNAELFPIYSPNEKEVYYYSPGGRIMKALLYDMNDVTEEWELEVRILLSYTSGGQLEEFVSSAWSSYLQSWLNLGKTIYKYNSKGDKKETIEYFWDETEKWDFNRRYIFLYNSQGQRTKKVQSEWLGNDFEEQYLTTYVYDGNGNLIIREKEDLLSENHEKTEWLYDTAGRLSTLIEYGWSNGSWMPANRYKYTYDSIGNLFYEYQEIYNEFGFNWYEDSRTTFFYNSDTLLSQELVEQFGEGYEPVSRTFYEYDSLDHITAISYEDFDWFEWDWFLGSRTENYWSEIENYCGIYVTVADTTRPSCPGDQDGSLTLRADGGTAPYSFIFNGGEETTDTVFTGLSGDVYYKYTVMGATGCSLTDSVKLSDPPPIGISIDKLDSDPGEETGFATAVVSGGTPPYSYLWTSGVKTQTAANLGSGLYFVTVTDSKGCFNNAVAAINDLGGPTIQVKSITDVSCYGEQDGAIDIEVVGVEPFTYIWTTGSQEQDVEGLSAGPQEVRVEDGNGLISVQSITVGGPEEIVLEVEKTPASCGGSDGSATVNVSGGSGAYAYLWSTGGTGQTEDELAAGAYEFTVTDLDGCSVTKTITISEAGSPVVVIDSVVNTACGQMNGGIYLSVPSATDTITYLWSNGMEEEDLTAVDEGSYYVTVTNVSGCKTVVTADVEMDNPLVNPICIVTVDSAAGTNLVAWERVQTAGIHSYRIYRESSKKDVYFLIGTVPVDEETLFNDESADPSIRSYRYKLAAVDSCGNESELSTHHKTMHLTLNLGLDNSVNLLWAGYEGFNVSTYDIWRFSKSVGWELLESVSSNVTSYSDFSPPLENLFYVVEVLHPTGCNYTELKAGTLNSSRSNRQSKLKEETTSVAFGEFSINKVSVYPTLTSGLINIEWTELAGDYITLEVHDLTGAAVMNQKYEHLDGSDFRHQLDLSFAAKGVYLMKLTGESGYSVTRIIIE